jgi:hypothetical protein
MVFKTFSLLLKVTKNFQPKNVLIAVPIILKKPLVIESPSRRGLFTFFWIALLITLNN